MRFKVEDILYTKWEQIPLKKLHIILQLLPVVNWEEHGDWMNTYAKNIILKYLFRSTKIYKMTTPEQRVDLFNQELGWLRESTSTFLFKEIKLDGKVFLSPEDGITDITVERLAEADTRLSRFIISQKAKYLDTFLACLYTVENQPFNAKTIAANAEILAKLDDYKKVSIIHSYMGSRTLIARLCDTLFPEPPKRKTKELPKPPDLGPMWDDLIFDLANTKGYAGVSAAKHANAIEALQYLDREIVHAKQQANHGKSTI